MALNMQEVKGQWNQLQGLVKKRWGQLTDDDLRVLGENLDELVGFIQQKTGEGREAIESFLSAMTSRSMAAVSHAAESAGRYTREGLHRAGDTVRHHPGPSAATVFGIGLVAGVLVGLAIRRR
jgi:uncharacterized protein YjbJ (UPF0337 family)